MMIVLVYKVYWYQCCLRIYMWFWILTAKCNLVCGTGTIQHIGQSIAAFALSSLEWLSADDRSVYNIPCMSVYT